MLEAYGVWQEKSMYGRKYMGVERTTFLIDARREDRPGLAQGEGAGHADEVLAAAKGL